MNSFELSEEVDPDKVFIINTSEIEKRLDPFYYLPEITELEKKVQKNNPKPLRHFVLSVASGATPKTVEKEKYYSDKENGIPFLRVQNLSPTGVLKLDNCKYINKETHNNYLKRSQVSASDLLVKITGVGRMAVASVAPENFIGNTNQHMVVVKTASREVSEILAAYLNSDIGEKLASRRATGGTRPALDYPALLSIPIVFDENILKITREAVRQKQQKEQQAKDLLESIDTYLLNELEVVIPKKDNSLKSRIYTTSINKLSGARLDAEYSIRYYESFFKSFKNSNSSIIELKNLISFLESGSRPKGGVNNISEGIFSIGGEHVDVYCNVGNGKPKYVPHKFHQQNKLTETKLHDIILVKDGATTGKIGIISLKEFENQNINEHVFIIRSNNNINPFYLGYFLYSSCGQIQLKREITGATVTGLTKEVVKKIKILIPSLEKQNEIANHITSIRQQAKQLQAEAAQLMNEAKQKVEKLILGEI